jgi:benzoyl-CoA reductase/2-hydroxyglutaryl-CoA dehydratase subunit BcrC/BadD/HgdB
MAVSALPRRLEVIEAFKQEGGSVAAVFPIHYPRALLRAFDVLPVEVWGPPRVETNYGAEHLQPNICSIVRNGLSFLLSGGLDVADVLVVPHACDSLQGLGSILIDLITTRQPVVPIYLPRGRRESDVDFLAEEFRWVYCRLETITGRTPADDQVLECVRREEEADSLLSDLHRNRSSIALADHELYRLIRAREYLPAETFTELARETLEQGEPPSCPQAAGSRAGNPSRDREGGADGRTPVVLSGIVPEPMDLLRSISDTGATVVADDLACCGRRLYPPGTGEEPFRRMAERLIHAPPDPTRGSPIGERLKHLRDLAEMSGAKGVVFYDVKFCDPELFDLPILSEGLDQAGIPSLAVEVDISDPLPYQVLTRMEAFLEMIR